ncbi:MAG: 50S ribosomal protein L9 [Phycisphaerae bacterium]
MKLLLCKNISTLGIVGDIVNVAPGYGRNYLVPQGLATEPTKANERKLAEARRLAEEERIHNRRLLETLAERLEGVEVTVRARANEDGVLYGSVGAREIAAALSDEGYPVALDQVVLESPIRHLDNVAVAVKLGEDLRSTVKVWVVRDKTQTDDDEAEGGATEAREDAKSGREAIADGDDSAGD